MQRSALILIELAQYSDEVYYKIVNSIGRGYHFSKMHSLSRTELWMIPKTKMEENEIIAQLKALTAVRNFHLIMIEDKAKTTDLPNVRKLFDIYGLDTSGVYDEQLLLYLDSVFKLENAYYLEFNRADAAAGPCKVLVKPAKEDPHYSARSYEKIKNWMLEEGEISPYNHREIIITSTQNVSVRKESPLD